jgi:hypothetical protein
MDQFCTNSRLSRAFSAAEVDFVRNNLQAAQRCFVFVFGFGNFILQSADQGLLLVEFLVKGIFFVKVRLRS